MTEYQINITLHRKDDFEYSKYVIELIKKLFHIFPSVYFPNDKHKESVLNIVISRTGLVKYLHSLGLVIGNKIIQKVNIPHWITVNKKYLINCLRGLIDTDGCIFTHTYRVNNKLYSYKKLSFTTYSNPLRKSVYNALHRFGFHPRMAQNRDVRLDRKEDILRYFQLIGTHNSKHLKRYTN